MVFDASVKVKEHHDHHQRIGLKIKVIIAGWIQAVLRIGTRYGGSNTKEGQRVVIEHTSSNPNGPLHIGNLRNVILGAHMAKLFEAVGYDVKQHFYVNDLGAQIGLTALGYQRIYAVLEPKLKIDQWIGMIYAFMNTLSELQLLNYSVGRIIMIILFFCSIFVLMGWIFLEDLLHFFRSNQKEILAKKGLRIHKSSPWIDAREGEEKKTFDKRIDFLSTLNSLFRRQPELGLALLTAFANTASIKAESAALNLSYEKNEPAAVDVSFLEMTIFESDRN